MIHISIKLFLEDIKTKSQWEKKNRAHKKDWWNRGTTVEQNVWQKYIPMYKSNNKYKCYKSNIQLDGHQYLKPKKRSKEKHILYTTSRKL